MTSPSTRTGSWRGSTTTSSCWTTTSSFPRRSSPAPTRAVTWATCACRSGTPATWSRPRTTPAPARARAGTSPSETGSGVGLRAGPPRAYGGAMKREPIEVHVVADSTGDTAARVARASAAQYAAYDVRIIRHPRISSVDGIHHVISHLDPSRTRLAAFSTVVDEQLREEVARLCAERGIPHADLLESALSALRQATGQDPERVVRPVGVGEDYFKRIHAMEFAIANDDGRLTSPLSQADIVLVGVSRTGKTPLSMYLGYLGYRTANI